jgi:hypothetical protein
MDDEETSRASSVRALWQLAGLSTAVGGIALVGSGFLRADYWSVAGGIGLITVSAMAYRRRNNFPTT